MSTNYEREYWEHEARIQILQHFKDFPTLKAGNLVIIKGRLGSGKTLIANALDRVLSIIEPPRPIVVDMGGGWLTRKLMGDQYVKHLVAQLEFLGEVGILVYQKLESPVIEACLERECRLFIEPKIMSSKGRVTINWWGQ